MVLKKSRWKVIPYRMSNDYEGKMIWASPEAEAPEVSLPLEAEGWYAVFVGLFSVSELPTTAWIRLNTDPAPVPRINKHTDHYGNSEEVFFRAVRLQKDSRLLFSPQNTGETSACGITHVKLIPLTNDEIRSNQTRRTGSLSSSFGGNQRRFQRYVSLQPAIGVIPDVASGGFPEYRLWNVDLAFRRRR